MLVSRILSYVFSRQSVIFCRPIDQRKLATWVAQWRTRWARRRTCTVALTDYSNVRTYEHELHAYHTIHLSTLECWKEGPTRHRRPADSPSATLKSRVPPGRAFSIVTLSPRICTACYRMIKSQKRRYGSPMPPRTSDACAITISTAKEPPSAAVMVQAETSMLPTEQA